MLKKYLKLLLCVAIVFSCISTVSFASSAEDDALISFVSGMEIMNGYSDGSFGFDRNVTRGEFSKIVVAASKYKNSVASSITVSPFADVPFTHWAAPYVRVASVNGYINGYVDATFKPDNSVLCEEAITVALKMLGYTKEDFGASWPYGQLGLAANLDLTDGITATIGQPMNRRDVARLIYNLMGTRKKGSSADYISDLDCSFNEDVVIVSTDGSDVVTSAGKFAIHGTLNPAYVGRRGNMVVKGGDTMVTFVPDTDNVDKYVVYSKVGGAIVAYKDGNRTQIDLLDSATAYYNSSKSTYGSVKNNIAMGDVIYVKKNSAGNVDYVSVESGSIKGPFTVRSSQWYSQFGNIGSASVMRDGVKVNLSDIKTYDVAYYSPDLNMIFAYSKKITGVYQSATPNTDSPESITVSGVQYKLESANALTAVSSSGQFIPGDTVTLLIGRGGNVADVVDPSASDATVVGYLLGGGIKEFTNTTGEKYTSTYIRVALVDGTEQEYITNKDYTDKSGSVVKVSFADGIATVSFLSARTGVSGRVSSDSRTIGKTEVSASVKIMDVAKSEEGKSSSWSSVFFQRIDGTTLSEKDILYYEKNSSGQITSLILNDVTGDAYKYGIVTKAESSSSDRSVSGRYSVDIGGKVYAHNISAVYNGIKAGYPVKAVMNGGSIDYISALPTLSKSIDKITSATIEADGRIYTISPDVVVYRKNWENDLMIAPLSEALESPTSLMTVFFDRSPSDGGQVRVIVLRQSN